MNSKRIFLVLIIFCVGTIAQIADDDFDGVTIEDEVENKNDVPYESPVPLNKDSVYLAEHFDDINKFYKKWIQSQAKKDNIAEEIAMYDGEWKLESSQKDALPGDMGLVLKSKAKHSAISSKLEKPFVFSTRPLVVQYEVLFQEGQECGGAYLKLLSEGHETSDLKQFHDKTPYTIMFGPDKCGNDHKLHFIFRHKNPLNSSLEEKHCNKPKERLEDVFKDKMPHLYTLIIRPDDSFEVWIDYKIVNSGSLLEEFSPPVNPPAEIDDPTDKKPDDWDEREKIPDPEAKMPDDWDELAPPQIINPDAIKPEGWLDDEEPMIPDPEAKQPEDWDTEMDGEWEAPLIDNPVCKTAVGCGKWEPPMMDNPQYKGKWRAPLIDNPNYKGKWRPRRIPNPDFFEDKHPFKMQTISAVGFELWSMSQDILFDNIIITDDVTVAKQWAADSFELKRKKIAHDSATFWGKMMRAMNYKPGWWSIYFIYCALPLIIYFWYLKQQCLNEESFLQRLLKYAEENPWLWVVYVVAVGLPIVLIVYCCCKSSDKETPEESKEKYDAATASTSKKTDAFTEDDEEPKDLQEKDKEISDIDEKDELIEEEQNEEEAENKTEQSEPSASGDAPRKRKVRKE